MSEGWRTVDSFTRDLTLAVEVVDAVGGGQPQGEPTVSVDGVDETPVRNRSGYYVFFDVPGGSHTVRAEGDTYHGEDTESVTLVPGDDTAGHDVGEAVTVELPPTPKYRFPSGLTRVRGTVLKDGNGVAGATVSTKDETRTTETSATGEFVFYFDEVDPDNDVVVSGGDRLYRPNGSDPTFVVDGPPGKFEQSVAVEVGSLTTQDLTY